MEIELSKKKKRAFKLAERYSKQGDDKDHKLGAIITLNGKVVSVGWNSQKTDTKCNSPYNTRHAESAAILSANTNLNGAEIYVHRNIHDGTLACSKPCLACSKLIKEAGIKKVYYTDNNSYKYYKVV